MKQPPQQDAAQAERPNQTHRVAGSLESPAKPASAHGQPFSALSSNSARVSMVSAQRKAIADNGLPETLKSGIEALSGMSMDHVKVHYNSSEPARINAHAYTQGSNIYVAPGQEKHLAHEAWHVVQQAQGRVRPTMQMKSGVQVNDDGHLEAEADVMGAKAMAATTMGASVQRATSETGGYLGLQKMGATGSVIQRFFAESEGHEDPVWIDGDPSEMGYEFAGYTLDEEKLIDVYRAQTAPAMTRFQDTTASPAIPSPSSSSRSGLSVTINNSNRKRSRAQYPDNSAAEVNSSLRSRPPATSAPAATSSSRRVFIGDDSTSSPAPTPPMKIARTATGLRDVSSLALSTSVISTAAQSREEKTESTTATIDWTRDDMPARVGNLPQWSKGHGTESESGNEDVAKGKTILRLSGADSVLENWEKKVDGGDIQAKSGRITISFVPRRSNPQEYRVVGTKSNGGRTHPRELSKKVRALAKSLNIKVVHEPQSPLPPDLDDQ